MADYHAQTQQNLQRADQKLDALVDITAQQKYQAGQINTELKDQNQMISNINDKMDNADQKVVTATDNVNKLLKKKSSMIAFLFMILFLIGIVLVWVLM
ncbi:SNARE domain containing protein [Trichomonas vaginalis G3]|uniref:SNARE domain containing protein n=1 Tax=Trichomonas vaginalis (strain ATCC PRA-98 / G3) TaxID=412133 RepID=A2EZK7_TRIV3|nr:SNARE fusion complex family [Trichomonas vaginalis G3]EAY01915.1 SNARE domain containing protein [Trichomonas vaginalis G3]KAI5485285.1 SNARE fusion complex family [Trichomonas vaginalis G3]|eukprot:XP_001314454.1 SNARE domain containing protein [Trichomonas vaginalis G3]